MASLFFALTVSRPKKLLLLASFVSLLRQLTVFIFLGPSVRRENRGEKSESFESAALS